MPNNAAMAQCRTFLISLPLFSTLPLDALDDVARSCRMARVGPDTVIFLEGDSAGGAHVLAEGRVKIVREHEDGREVILRIIQPGEAFGVSGGWGTSHYPASAVAMEPSVVLRFPARELTALILRYPPFALALIQELGQRLREAEARIGGLQTERVERRIARELLLLADQAGCRTPHGLEIAVPLSRQDLADLCGTTQSTVSRTLSAWDRAGIIRSRRERVVIVDRDALAGIADTRLAPA